MAITYPVTCSDPDHGTREGTTGWQTILGQSSIPGASGMICPACAAALPPAAQAPTPATSYTVDTDVARLALTPNVGDLAYVTTTKALYLYVGGIVPWKAVTLT